MLVVDPGVDLRDIAPLSCGIQTGAGTVINELKPALGDTLAVFGAGAVGGGAIMGGVIAGCSRINGAVDTTSRPEVLRAAADSLALRGTLLLVGGSVFPVFVPQLIRLWQAGRFPFEKMLRRYPFEKIDEAIDDSIRGDTIKPVLVF